MLRSTETPEQTAHRCAAEIRAALRRAGRRYLRFAADVDGLHITIGAGRAKGSADPAADLPPELRKARPSIRQTYRALRALREEFGPEVAVWPEDVVAWLDAEYADTDHSLDTVNHALRDLRVLRLAWSPLDRRTDDRRGWRLGAPGGGLPISAGQTDGPSAPELRCYVERMAAEGVRRFDGGTTMFGPKVWVPGERDEYGAGVVVTDARTEQAVAVTERTGEMRVPTRSGALARVPAARGELVCTEGKFATVKFAGGARVTVRVLGAWQLEGRTEPEPEGAEVSGGAGGVNE